MDLISLLSKGQANRLPDSIFMVEFVDPSVYGGLPDSLLIVKLSEDSGGSYPSYKVPLNLFDERSRVVNLCVCITYGISPIII